MSLEPTNAFRGLILGVANYRAHRVDPSYRRRRNPLLTLTKKIWIIPPFPHSRVSNRPSHFINLRIHRIWLKEFLNVLPRTLRRLELHFASVGFHLSWLSASASILPLLNRTHRGFAERGVDFVPGGRARTTLLDQGWGFKIVGE